jgi:hypothetical protein
MGSRLLALRIAERFERAAFRATHGDHRGSPTESI